jgi:hypothetical protein
MSPDDTTTAVVMPKTAPNQQSTILVTLLLRFVPIIGLGILDLLI